MPVIDKMRANIANAIIIINIDILIKKFLFYFL